jgi:GAF domain-containing protein
MDPIMAAIPLFLVGLLLRYAMNSMNRALERARRNERAQAEANRELEAIRASLEVRVTERTRELERRSTYLEAASEVGRAATSILEIDRLIWRVADLIRRRFDLYHVGLFLVDATGGWAEYRAGSGTGGYALAEEEFRLEVGGPSMVGWCTAHARARVAQDVGQETRRVEHALVPQTRSEAALPLVARGVVIGALSVQSDKQGAFDQDAVRSLQSMADQVAVALDNARLFAETEAALEAERRAYGEVSREAWAGLVRDRPDWGYLCGSHGTLSPVRGEWQPEMVEAGQTGRIVQGDGQVVALPVRIQDNVVGVVRLRKPDEAGPWTQEEISLMESVAGQLGLTLESARLHQETQRRAVREQLVAQVSAQVRASLDPDTILKTSVRELSRVLGAEWAAIELAEPPGDNGDPTEGMPALDGDGGTTPTLTGE